jgi:hypothetical protein
MRGGGAYEELAFGRRCKRLDIPGDPDLQFSFTFGNLSVGTSNLDPNSDLRVMLSDSAGSGIVLQNAIIACVNTLFPRYAVQDGTEVLRIYMSFGSADRYVGFTTQTAYVVDGAWTAVPVPEPSITVLSAFALAGFMRDERRSSSEPR